MQSGKTHWQGHQDPSKSVPIFLRGTKSNSKMVPIGWVPIPRSRTVPHQIGVALAPPARWRFRINICLFRIQYCEPFLLQYACSLVLYRLLLPWHVQESNMGQQAPAVFSFLAAAIKGGREVWNVVDYLCLQAPASAWWKAWRFGPCGLFVSRAPPPKRPWTSSQGLRIPLAQTGRVMGTRNPWGPPIPPG